MNNGRNFFLLLTVSTGLWLAACGNTPRTAPAPTRQQQDPVPQATVDSRVEKKAEEAKPAVPIASPEPQVKKPVNPAPPASRPPPIKPIVEVPRREKPPTVAKPAVKTSPGIDRVTSDPAPGIVAGKLTGRIRLIGKSGEAIDSSGVIINLEPVNKTNLPEKPAREHLISMVDKTYLPAVLTMRKNDTLSFVNGDRIKHNVFSSSGDNTFDLGTYGAGKTRSVKLGNSGVVKVYCNIHPEMATFVNVSEHDIATVTGADGSFEIARVPAGQYKVRIWHVRGEMERDLTVNAGTPAKLELIMDTSNYRQVPHKNKHGKDYKKTPALFEDEFY